MKRKSMITTALVSVMLAVGVAVAPSAQAGGDEQFFVQTVTQNTLLESDFELRDFACDWFRFDRADLYRSSWREVWSGEGISYRDMRLGIYRAMRNVCW